MNHLSDALIALIRTIVPLLMGSLITWLALPAEAAELLHLIALTVVTALYYAAARALSERWPIAGWLLGYPLNPSYRPDSEND